VVCGAGGFIGSHLVKRLKADGAWVRGVDVKRPEFARSAADEFELLDLRDMDQARRAVAPSGPSPVPSSVRSSGTTGRRNDLRRPLLLQAGSTSTTSVDMNADNRFTSDDFMSRRRTSRAICPSRTGNGYSTMFDCGMLARVTVSTR
jgi:NAD dependent epimerase/dehydratase family